MKTILVTGFSGVLGSAILKIIENQNDAVVLLGGRKTNKDSHYHFDVNDNQSVQKLIKETRPELVYNLLGSMSANWEDSFKSNCDLTHTLLEETTKTNNRCRVVLIGSAAEYGVVKPEENPISEYYEPNPVSTYGLTKLIQTKIARKFIANGADIVIARVFNLLGPEMNRNLFIGSIQAQIQLVKNGQKDYLTVGNLTEMRDYISVTNAAELIVRIAERGQSGEIYNVGSGKPTSIEHILQQMLAEENLSEIPIKVNENIVSAGGTTLPLIFADMTKTHALLDG